MPRTEFCKDCNKRKAPEHKLVRCPDCHAAWMKKRAVTWCSISLARSGEIHFCCNRCNRPKLWDNYRKPLPDTANSHTPTIDRMAVDFRTFKREHRRSGVPAKAPKQPKPRKKTAVAS